MIACTHNLGTFARPIPGRSQVRPKTIPRSPTRVHGIGQDVVGGFLDLTKLVSGSTGSGRSPFDDLAYAIGRDVYVDVAGWHLYTRDLTATPGLKMSQLLATQLGPMAGDRKGVSRADVEGLLRKIPVKLGAGRIQVSLLDVMPATCVEDLVRTLEDNSGRR